jgi:hypothetical protein
LRLAASQAPSRLFFGPAAATADGPASLVDAGPLYAGQRVAPVSDVHPTTKV